MSFWIFCVPDSQHPIGTYCVSPFMVLFCRASRANQCSVSVAKQPCRRNLETAEFDPSRTCSAFFRVL